MNLKTAMDLVAFAPLFAAAPLSMLPDKVSLEDEALKSALREIRLSKNKVDPTFDLSQRFTEAGICFAPGLAMLVSGAMYYCTDFSAYFYIFFFSPHLTTDRKVFQY